MNEWIFQTDHRSKPSSEYEDQSKAESQFDAQVVDVPVLIHTTERKLMAKIDWHILPVLSVLYLLAFLDR